MATNENRDEIARERWKGERPTVRSRRAAKEGKAAALRNRHGDIRPSVIESSHRFHRWDIKDERAIRPRYISILARTRRVVSFFLFCFVFVLRFSSTARSCSIAGLCSPDRITLLSVTLSLSAGLFYWSIFCLTSTLCRTATYLSLDYALRVWPWRNSVPKWTVKILFYT